MASQENTALVANLRNRPALAGTTPQEWRDQFASSYGNFPHADGIARSPVAVRDDLDGEWFRGGGQHEAVILYVHGGGYMLGCTRSHRPLISNLVAASGIDALGINYRLAPEHPFPCGLEDVIQGYQYLLTSGYQPKHIAIAGDSAGGGLAAALLLAIRDRGMPRPACGVLMSPWMDLTCSAQSLERNLASDPLVAREVLEAMAWAYVPDKRLRDDPLVSPLFASLTGLPPLLIQVSTAEVLEDDSVRFAEKAKKAGVSVTLESTDEVVHVWHQYAHLIPEGRQAIDRAADFLRRPAGTVA